MEKHKKQIRKIIIAAVTILVLLSMLRLYTIFVHPLIYPFFFKISNIENLVGVRLHMENILEYTIVPEPTYSFAGTSGIKEIFAMTTIGKEAYEAIVNNNSFYIEEDFTWINCFLSYKNRGSVNFENAVEIHVRYYFAPIYNREYFGFFMQRFSHPARTAQIFIILTKETISIQEQDEVASFLYVFNVNESRFREMLDFRNKSNC